MSEEGAAVAKITVIQQGEQLPFIFDRDGESIDGWVCTIEVHEFPGDSVGFTARIIPPGPSGIAWPGFLTNAETVLLTTRLYRLVGVLVNASTGQQEYPDVRFNVTEAWPA